MSGPKLSKDELSDLEVQFAVDFSDQIAKYEDDFYACAIFYSDVIPECIENCHRFIKAMSEAKKFCYSHGHGGKEYYRNMWKNDPRVIRAKRELELYKKYPAGLNDESVKIEIIDFLKTKGPASKTDIYKLFGDVFGAKITPVLKNLLKQGTIQEDASTYPKLFFLPEPGATDKVLAVRRTQKEHHGMIDEIAAMPDEGLTISIAEKDIADRIDSIAAELLPQKKKGLFSRLFGKKVIS